VEDGDGAVGDAEPGDRERAHDAEPR
jgi:hypothetical protein